jgi:hypothetical protein
MRVILVVDSIAWIKQNGHNFNNHLNYDIFRNHRVIMAMSMKAQSQIAKRNALRAKFEHQAEQMLQVPLQSHPAPFKNVQMSLMTVYEAIAGLKCDDHVEYIREFNLRYIQIMNKLVSCTVGNVSAEEKVPSESLSIEQISTSIKSLTLESPAFELHEPESPLHALEIHASCSDILTATEPEIPNRRPQSLDEEDNPRAKQLAMVSGTHQGTMERPRLSISIPLNLDMREFLNRRHSAPPVAVRSEIHVVQHEEVIPSCSNISSELVDAKIQAGTDRVTIRHPDDEDYKSPFVMPSHFWPPAPLVALQDERPYQVAPIKSLMPKYKRERIGLPSDIPTTKIIRVHSLCQVTSGHRLLWLHYKMSDHIKLRQ